MITSLRPATIADVPLLLQLIRELAEYEHLSDQVNATEERLRAALFPATANAANAAPRPIAECVLAFADEQPAGFVLFFTNFSTFLTRHGLYVEDLFVRPAFRRHGLGTALLRHVAGLACARDCGRLEWAVLNWNEPALAFYASLGAQRLTEWTTCRVTGDALRRLAAG
ncbi:MAG: GNAT family N-acetyltransferase [Opitutae bacterium]|nr:GNAT family N-acetyltransferase [Opitutae bacterium]